MAPTTSLCALALLPSLTLSRQLVECLLSHLAFPLSLLPLSLLPLSAPACSSAQHLRAWHSFKLNDYCTVMASYLQAGCGQAHMHVSRPRAPTPAAMSARLRLCYHTCRAVPAIMALALPSSSFLPALRGARRHHIAALPVAPVPPPARATFARQHSTHRHSLTQAQRALVRHRLPSTAHATWRTSAQP